MVQKWQKKVAKKNVDRVEKPWTYAEHPTNGRTARSARRYVARGSARTLPNVLILKLTKMSNESRDSSPVRLPKLPGKQGRHTTPPPGFRRNTCPLGHACSNSRCYQSLADPAIYWDQRVSSKPYFPPGKSKYDLMDIPFYAQDKKAKKKAKKQAKKQAKNHRKAINKSKGNQMPDDDVKADLQRFKQNQRDRREVQKHDRSQSVKNQILAQGMLWPGTPEYEAKVKAFRDAQAQQLKDPMIQELAAIEQSLTKE